MDNRRKRKNSAPLPGYGKKAIQPSTISPLPTSMLTSKPLGRDGVDILVRSPDQLDARVVFGSACTVLSASTTAGAGSSSSSTSLDGLSLSQPAETLSNNASKKSGNTKGKQRMASASRPMNRRGANEGTNFSQTSTTDHTCGSCHVGIPDDQLDRVARHCCLCDRYFHGSCCKIDESLMEYIHIVSEIGGWCCIICRIAKRINVNNSKSLNQTQKNAENIDSINQELTKINDQLKCLTSNFSLITSSASNGNRSVTNDNIPTTDLTSSSIGIKQSYAQTLQSSKSKVDIKSTSPPKLEKQLQTAVLTAVHAEFNSISKRALSIVVTGLPPSITASDEDQFVQICFSSLDITPNVKSTHRLGDKKPDKVQPLHITLSSAKEGQDILNVAKCLRKAPSEFVRENVYFNKHLTKA